MEDKAKQNVKPAKVKPAKIKPVKKQEHEGKNKLVLFLSFLFLGALFVSFIVPVYYVPLFNNISSRYGLSIDIARKLTLLDLALSSVGIETPNMAVAFKQNEVEYEPDVFLISRFNMDGASHLINAKETYYHEYERTHKRPAEVAGVYRDGTAVDVPEIDGDLRGVRALPEENYFDGDDVEFTDFSYKKSTVTTSSKDEVMGSKRRQVRGSFDRQEQGTQNGQGKGSKPAPLPDFASSIYDQAGKGETQTLENSRMVKPVVSGDSFSVIRSESVVAKLVGDTSFTDMFSPLKNFGGYNGILGYYIKDTLPSKTNLFNFFGNSGQDVFNSYFYSHAAVDRKYIESSKHLAEIAFNGDEPQDEILIARGQKQDKIPTVKELDMSPLDLILTVKHNMKECREAGERYRLEVAPLQTAYENAKTNIIRISENRNNFAWRGAPGSCDGDNERCRPTKLLRRSWNDNVRNAKEKCIAIRQKNKAYANSCKMEYTWDTENNDSCEAIAALELDGGEPWVEFQDIIERKYCRVHVKWLHLNVSKKFNTGCGSEAGISLWNLSHPDAAERQIQYSARRDCVTKINNLFDAIDANMQLDTKPGFVFVD